MRTKTTLRITLAIIFLVGVTSLALADHGRQDGWNHHPQGVMKHDGYGHDHPCATGHRGNHRFQLSPEKQEAYQTMMKEFRARMIPLREAMWQKKLELKALSPNPNTKPEDLKALVRAINNLHVQMCTEREALHARLEKEVGMTWKGKGVHPFHHGRQGHHGCKARHGE